MLVLVVASAFLAAGPTAATPTAATPTPGTPTAATPPAATSTIPPLRVLVLDVEGDTVEAATRRSMTALLVERLGQDPRFTVISRDDLKNLASLEAEKQAVGCDDSCMTELADAMGARFVLSGVAGRLGTLPVVHLSLFDARAATAVGRATIQAPVEEFDAALGRALPELLRTLTPADSTVRATRTPSAMPLVLYSGAAIAGVGAAALSVLAGFLLSEQQTARDALDRETERFDAGDDVQGLKTANRAYADAHSAYASTGPWLWLGAGALAAMAIGSGVAGAILQGAE